MRIVFFDNLKGVLILLVVFGHFILPVHDENAVLDYLYQFIYMFHMPLFVFVSGLFAKNVFRNGVLRVERVISSLVLGLLFQLVLIAINQPDGGLAANLLDVNAAPWYMFSLAFWYMSLPVFARIRPPYALTASVLISLAAGCFDELGDFLALSRTMVFLPFFLAGYYCTTKQVLAVRRRWNIVVPSWVITVAFAVFLAIFRERMSTYTYILEGRLPYKGSDLHGMALRAIYGVVACAISIAVMSVVPCRPILCNVLGERSLQIYVLHRILRPILQDLGLYDLGFIMHPVFGTLFLLVFSALVAVVCSYHGFTVAFNKLYRASWSWLLVDRSPKAAKKQ